MLLDRKVPQRDPPVQPFFNRLEMEQRADVKEDVMNIFINEMMENLRKDKLDEQREKTTEKLRASLDRTI